MLGNWSCESHAALGFLGLTCGQNLEKGGLGEASTYLVPVLKRSSSPPKMGWKFPEVLVTETSCNQALHTHLKGMILTMRTTSESLDPASLGDAISAL